MNIILIFLSVLLILSWFIFLRYYAKSLHKETAAVKRWEEAKRQLKEQVAGLDSVIGLLTGIHELGLTNTDSESKRKIAQMIVDSACQIMHCPKGALWLLDKEPNVLLPIASKGIAEPALLNSRIPVGEGVSGRVVQLGKTITVGDMESDRRFIEDKTPEYRSRSLIAVPVQVRNHTIGVLSVFADQPHHNFDERTVRLLTILANQSAMTLENLDLYASFQRFYLEMVETLVHALELKENVRRSYVTREKQRIYARQIAEKLDLPETLVRHIEFAALIHGIGKMGVDDAILRKPGKLTDAEYELVKKHPEISQEILARVEFLSPVTPIILYHQERWDGKGYPAGLVGEEIPLGSRIVSVINAFQAMVADRPYRSALSKTQAIRELKVGAGGQFDPKVVETFVEILKDEPEFFQPGSAAPQGI